MNIIAGTLKGKKILFPKRYFPNAQTTPSKVKEAVFSILGNNLYGKSFLDLFACSGQIGLEAISRGANFVLFNDINSRCIHNIAHMIEEWQLTKKALVLRMPANRCISYCTTHGFTFDIAFVDPPYEKIKGTNSLLERILKIVCAAPIFTENARIIVQHYYANELPQQIGKFSWKKTRRYGTTSITEYQREIPESLL